MPVSWGGEWQWVGKNWWYKLAHVCQRWQELILGSAFYLGLSLVCRKGTPDMKKKTPQKSGVLESRHSYIAQYTPPCSRTVHTAYGGLRCELFDDHSQKPERSHSLGRTSP